MNRNGVLSVIVISAIALTGLWALRTGQRRAGARQFDCDAAPEAPTDLIVEAIGNVSARMTWTAPSGADAPTSYMLESGSGPGKNDVATFIIAGATTTIDRAGVPGTFFLRVHARNVCGTSVSSNEVSITLQ